MPTVTMETGTVETGTMETGTVKTDMMNSLLSRLIPLALVAPAMLVSGCTERRVGLGGGATSPVKVTLLREGGGGAPGAEAAAAPVEAPKGFGTFKGKITVNGAAPTLPMLVTVGQSGIKDPVCNQNGVPNESVIVGPDGGLANVYIYLKKAPNIEIPPPPTEPITVDQQGCKFVPHSAIVRVGQPIKMINSDPAAHNVAIAGTVLTFNTTLSKGDEAVITAKSAERNPISMTCSFHGWMNGNLFPVDHPWAVVTGPDGSFEIPSVPAGNMEFVIWHEKVGLVERSVKVDIPIDGVAEKSFQVDAAKLQ